MDELAKMHCIKISAETPRLNQHEIDQYDSRLPDWKIYTVENEPRLEKVFKVKDFNQAIEFTNKVARIANEEDHHPAILTEWGRVTVTWWTHKIQGLTLNDFIMAAKTDRIMG